MLGKTKQNTKIFDSNCIFTGKLFFRNAAGEDVEKVDFIPIFVYDDQLREYVRDHLKRLDRVRIEGEMKQKWAIDEFGKRKSSGYIKANRINKMVSLHKVSRSALPEDQRSFLDVSP